MKNDNAVSIAFLTGGGAGNQFVQMNFIYCVYRYLQEEAPRIVVFGHKSRELNDLLMKGQDFISEYYPPEESDKGYTFDAFIHLEFFPDVLMESADVERKSPRLHQLLSKWRAFMDDPLRRHGVLHPQDNYNVYIYGIDMGKTVLNVADVDGILGVGKEYSWKLRIGGEEYLKELGLVPGEYITIQRGATPNSFLKESPKLWPIEHYEELIRLLKIIYPEKKIVQLGEETNSEKLDHVDIELLGKTSWEQLGSLLQHAWLHIDGECGMVHFRKALSGGCSVVLFGPTPMEFYGYDGNINIRSDGCPQWCARLTNAWLERCARGFEKPPCMAKITPGMVLGRIVAWQRLNLIREGKMKEALSFKNNELYDNSDIRIDEGYRKNYLNTYWIIHYEKARIQLDKLRVFTACEKGCSYIPVSDTAAYAAALGGQGWDKYENYLVNLREKYYNNIHTKDRYRNLMDEMEKQGYDLKFPILIDGNDRILDGQHRAAWLAAKFGTSYVADVVRIFCLRDIEGDLWDFFPFDKIPCGSNILIYGTGAIGEAYIRQIDYTGYCSVMALVDRNPEKWNMDPNKRERVICIYPKDIKNMKEAYDYIVIASRNGRNIKAMKDYLIGQGIDMEKVVAYPEESE